MVAPNIRENEDKIISLNHMYQDYFLDYASYVILERAVPAVEDGLKPVQRRILHALREMDDGRFHKVANVIGQTMQFHPHGDASITDALVNMGQKDLLIDCQGNWGDVRTGDSAAAARYIEARLTKFALEVVFNGQTTNWQLSYDGRKKEPVALPVKFPLLLAHGVEGIAVGLSTKILPHNFVELIEGSIAVLRGQSPNLLPDFRTGGMVDVSNYNAGKRGGKVRVRAKIEISKDKKSLIINELPFGTTTGDLIESILKAADKGKIKIKKVVDNTAAVVEIGIELMPGTSPDVTLDALYAFTDCEMSISPNACIIIQDRPHFLDVHDILTRCTFQTKELLRRELEIRRSELEELMHFASLEKIFIENRIYHKIETAESWEQVLEIIPTQLKKYVVPIQEKPRSNDKRIRLFRAVSDNDVARLTEIKIKRISKYNAFSVEEYLKKLEHEYNQVKFNLENLNDYSIQYFEGLLKKYGKGRERKTEIRVFDNIQAAEVVANNAKLYANFKEGFIGLGLKKDDFISDCSDIDDIIVFRKDGKFQVLKVADKVFVGKDLLHVAVWRKGDERTTYNLLYMDGKTGVTHAKRFNVTAITRNTEYDLTQGNPNSRVLYFTSNPNSESEIVEIGLSQASTATKKILTYDFAELAIKGRTAHGNIVTKYPVRRVTHKEAGKSTIGAKKIWMDSISGKLNTDERGQFLGEFDTGDKILAIYKDGTYEICEPEINKYFEINPLCFIGKWDIEGIIAAVYFDGNKECTMVKRFKIETLKTNERFLFVTEHKKTQLLLASVEPNQKIQYSMKVGSKKVDGVANLDELAEVKGWKALGNKMSDQKLMHVAFVSPESEDVTDLFSES
ncbi:MAG: hypothetical protein RIS64_2169 [Bacteroidota bacterium]|jgi:topoisomerase IV subunit A